MGIIDKVFGRKREGKSALRLPSEWKRYVPWSSSASAADHFALYMQNATVFACMGILQNTFPEPELWAWEEGEQRNELKPLMGHDLRKLMRKPNLSMGEAEFLQFVATYAPLSGNVYLWKEKQVNGVVKGLHPLHDGQMRPVKAKNMSEGLVAYYVLLTDKPNNGNPYGVERYADDHLQGIAIPVSEVIQWKWRINPLSPESGIGALEASAGDAKLANEVRDFVFSYLKNDGTPPFIVKLVEGDDADEGTIKRLKKQWMQNYGGKNKGVPAFLEAGMDVEKLGSSLKDLDASSLRDGPDAAICMGFGIHPAVVGTLVGLKHSTFSNFEEARQMLAEQTLVPLWRSFASEMEQGLVGEVGYAADVRIKFDLAQVVALQETEDAKEVRLGRALDRGGITRAEYRRGIGFDADKADEVYKETLAVIWTRRGQLRETDPDMLAGKNKSSVVGSQFLGSASHFSEKAAADIGQALRRIRGRLAGQVEVQLKGYFAKLADEVVAVLEVEKRKANLSGDAPLRQMLRSDTSPQRGEGKAEYDSWAADLLDAADNGDLEKLLKGFYVTILEASWETWNVSLSVQAAFDLKDPVVTQILGTAGARARAINETTLKALRDALQYASDEGWGIDQIVRGDAENGIRGLREIVDETYSGRAENIARTELGDAQNAATVGRYADAGVEKVLILDNGDDDDDSACKIANGQVWTLAYFDSHRLEHPRCTRAAAAYFGERAADVG